MRLVRHLTQKLDVGARQEIKLSMNDYLLIIKDDALPENPWDPVDCSRQYPAKGNRELLVSTKDNSDEMIRKLYPGLADQQYSDSNCNLRNLL